MAVLLLLVVVAAPAAAVPASRTSSVLTILPRPTWTLYSAFLPAASDSSCASTASDAAAYASLTLSSDEAGEM